MDDQRIPRHLALPDSVASDPKAYELLAAWAAAGKVTVMCARGTGLQPEMWGEILASIADNIALLAQSTENQTPKAVLAGIKAGMDREWAKRDVKRAKSALYRPRP